jgi:pimeloyl-ACP methyl ester carboxylesterase
MQSTAVQDVPRLDAREEHFHVAGPLPGLRLFLRYLPPMRSTPSTPRPVLYVHGGTFPSALSIAHRFDGRSWRDELADAGFHVWGLDFHGFGVSDPYPEMAEPAARHPPLGRAAVAAAQIECAAAFIAAHHDVARISIIAHSWGTIAAGRFATQRADLVDRLVLFGPIARRPISEPGARDATARCDAWRLVSLDAQWARFTEDVPQGAAPVLSRRHFDDWGERYLDSDAASRTRKPASVKVPSGPRADIAAAHAGALAYDPALIHAPTAIIRGAWDSLIPDADARWLFDALGVPIKRDIKIGRGTHLMHLEETRYQLYREAQAFLAGNDTP